MHAIMDAERDATLDYLDRVTRQMGGRRGRARVASPTGGLVYAHTRHATSRAGDPCPHDHALLANVVQMLDGRGGWKAPDTALWREHLHAATMVGRAAAARGAVDLGYGIEADPGPSGRLGHWRIAGVPQEVMEVHSKRAAEITAECDRRGDRSYRARAMAARSTRRAKEAEGVEGQLMERWQAELASVGWPLDRLAAAIDAAGGASAPIRRMGLRQVRQILSEALGPDGDLARRKVFFRRDVIVALAPHLYGQNPRLVEVLADRALADPEAVPLVGVPGARERPYTLASVVATEKAIAACLGRQIDRHDAPAVDAAGTARAVAAVESGLDGGLLSAEQRAAAEAICTSGRGCELVVGVAGAGKTTMLRAVANAFEAAGCRVVGTATSGQAARNLGEEAEIRESRTLASLTWRLDRGQLTVDDRTVVVCDEAGMTNDVALARLAGHVEAAGAKLVLAGDHRQLAAVGPGGALQALVERHPEALHRLVENRRQRDTGERRALAELREGDVARAVSWYEERGRIHPLADRDRALQATVDAWASDLAADRRSSMYAWRRANVAALNARARDWMADNGRLHGPELVCEGGLAYRAGDQVVTLAPGPGGVLVTSERGVVEAVDTSAGAVVIRTGDGRTVTLTGEQAAADRLGHGYATTVHRAQGATVDRAHLLADGGGRELAYVAMSRARESTHIWAAADDTAQAVEDLQRDWDRRRSPGWAIDLAPPDWDLPRERLRPEEMDQRAKAAALAAARIRITHHAVTGIRAPGHDPAVSAAQAELQQAMDARTDLRRGTGTYLHSEAGQAILDLEQARAARRRAEYEAQHAPGRRQRRAARKEDSVWETREADAQQRHDVHVMPELARLDQRIEAGQRALEAAESRRARYQQASGGVAEFSMLTGRQASQLSAGLARYRNDIDGVAQQPVPGHTSRLLRAPSRSAEPTTGPTPQHDIGM